MATAKTKENAETQRARRSAEKDKGNSNSVEARFLPFYIQNTKLAQVNAPTFFERYRQCLQGYARFVWMGGA
jgi:hypothetical protein